MSAPRRDPARPAPPLFARRLAGAAAAVLIAEGAAAVALTLAGVTLPAAASLLVIVVTVVIFRGIARMTARRPQPPPPPAGAVAAALAWRVSAATGIGDPGEAAVITAIMRDEAAALGAAPVEQLAEEAFGILADRAVSFWADLGHPATVAQYRAVTGPVNPGGWW